MPNDVVDAVHRLTVTSKQTGGITFTNTAGNILTEDDEDEMEPEDIPIPPDNGDDDIRTETDDINQETTGVDDAQDTGNMETEMEVETENVETAGVDYNDMTRTEYVQESNISTPKEENDPDNYITVADINITTELNASNRESDDTENESEGRTNVRYNLCPKPRNTTQYTITQSTENSITLPKTHTHIMMTQLNVQDGLKAYGEKGDKANHEVN